MARQKAKKNKRNQQRQLYRYIAYNRRNKQVTGTIQAISEQDAITHLEARGLIVTSIKQTKVSKLHMLKPNELYFFAYNLANFIQTGFPITEALELLSSKSLNRNFEQIILDTIEGINNGLSISEAMQATGCFPKLFVAFIQAGENTGRLDEALSNVAFFYETQIEVNSKFRNAMIYPMLLSVIALGIIFLYVFYVVPSLADVYGQVGVGLPWITRAVIGFGTFLANWWWLLLLALGGGIWLLRRTMRHPVPTTFAIEQFLFHLPVFGSMFIYPEYLRLGTIILNGYESGLNIIDILTLAKDVVTTQTMKTTIRNVAQRIDRGSTIAQAFEKTSLDPIFVKSITLGERSGALSDVLHRYISVVRMDYFHAIDNFAAKIEPVMLLTIGGVVGIIVIALYMPMFNLVPTVLQGGGI